MSSAFVDEQALRAYLALPVHQRPLAFYNPAVLVPASPVFTAAEVARLLPLRHGGPARSHAQSPDSLQTPMGLLLASMASPVGVSGTS